MAHFSPFMLTMRKLSDPLGLSINTFNTSFIFGFDISQKKTLKISLKNKCVPQDQNKDLLHYCPTLYLFSHDAPFIMFQKLLVELLNALTNESFSKVRNQQFTK